MTFDYKCATCWKSIGGPKERVRVCRHCGVVLEPAAEVPASAAGPLSIHAPPALTRAFSVFTGAVAGEASVLVTFEDSDPNAVAGIAIGPIGASRALLVRPTGEYAITREEWVDAARTRVPVTLVPWTSPRAGRPVHELRLAVDGAGMRADVDGERVVTIPAGPKDGDASSICLVAAGRVRFERFATRFEAPPILPPVVAPPSPAKLAPRPSVPPSPRPAPTPVGSLPQSKGVIFAALAANDRDTMIRLLDEGVSVDSVDEKGRSLLLFSVEEAAFGMMDLLLARGASTELAGRGGRTPLHLAATGSTPAVLGRLIDAGANLHARTDWGATPLLEAAAALFEDGIVYLLSRGANLADKDSSGQDLLGAIEGAVAGPQEYGEANQLKTSLRLRGILPDPSAPRAVVSTPEPVLRDLLDAAEAGDALQVSSVLRAGAMLDQRDARRETALHRVVRGSAAASGGNDGRWVDVAVLLVARGADRSLTNSEGATPAELAADFASRGVAAFLGAIAPRVFHTTNETDLHSYVLRRQSPTFELRRLDLRGTRGSGLTLDGGTLLECNLDGASITYSSAKPFTLVASTLRGASMVHTAFEGGLLRSCDLRCVDLRMGGFYQTSFDGVSMAGAAMEDTHVVDCTLNDVSFFAARLACTQLDRSRFAMCDFRCADLKGDGRAGTLRRAVFDRCDFEDADFDQRLLEETIFTNCRFTGSRGTPRITHGCEIRETSPIGLPDWARPLLK